MKNKQFEPFEPKIENRWIVQFPEYFNLDSFVFYKTTRPSFKLKQYGKIKWDDMCFTLYDPICPSTSQKLIKGIKELNKQDSQVICIKINILGPIGDEVEKWEINGEIYKINFGELDYTSSELLFVKVYFKVNYAKLIF